MSESFDKINLSNPLMLVKEGERRKRNWPDSSGISLGRTDVSRWGWAYAYVFGAARVRSRCLMCPSTTCVSSGSRTSVRRCVSVAGCVISILRATCAGMRCLRCCLRRYDRTRVTRRACPSSLSTSHTTTCRRPVRASSTAACAATLCCSKVYTESRSRTTTSLT
jgi:hypothetical protein